MTSFNVFSLGCRVNQAELEKINQELILEGYLYNKDNPDFIIINSCAVTRKAERQTRQIIYQQRKIHPQAKIYLTGCAATLWNKILLSFRNPDLIGISGIYKNIQFIPNSQKQNLIKIVETQYFASLQNGANQHIDQFTSPKSRAIARDKGGRQSAFMQSGRLLVKIQDGCRRFCSYCIVPYLRGKPKSKTIKEIINEINNYCGGGLKCPPQEAILTAINTADFGKENKETLTDLLKAVLAQTTTPRVSFGSINPWSLTNEFINLIKRCHLVHFFHIPIQSGSDKILKLMSRGYTAKNLLQKLNKLSEINPFALIATDIIVGFPGETDEDFEQTLNFIKNSPIVKVHIFPFSPREGTKAVNMVKTLGVVNHAILKLRLSSLKTLSALKFSAFQKSLLGQTSPALFLQKRVGNYQKALLNNQVPVWIKSKEDLKGKIKEVQIQDFQQGKLIGKIIK